MAKSDPQAMTKLLARLSEQQAVLRQQNDALQVPDDIITFNRALDHGSSSNSLPVTPATESFQATAPTTRPASATFPEDQNQDQVNALRLQLAQAQEKISKLAEIASSRTESADMQPKDLRHGPELSSFSRESAWNPTEDTNSDTSDPGPVHRFGRSRGIWNDFRNHSAVNLAPPPRSFAEDSHMNGWPRSATSTFSSGSTMPMSEQQNGLAPMDNYRGGRLTPDSDFLMRRTDLRNTTRYDGRDSGPAGFFPSYAGAFPEQAVHYDPLAGPRASNGQMTPASGYGSTTMSLYGGGPPGPVNSLSPHASEFTSSAGWRGEESLQTCEPRKGCSANKSQMLPVDGGPTYLPPTEPLNYRRLLDRNVNCNWKYIVDKIVCNNDQQASIFLQQKLKVGTPEQKYEIVEAIVAQAYPLMVNRFGNFLVQRCFEHGTPEQVIKIAEAIRGHTLNLSMDPFGCHVVQKAFDSVPEDYKAVMVNELLRRIPETVIHRYACHVWQKLFELRWTESPPQIMKYVNESLQGMWHEVALGETGSLVVQNIFENCLEDDKRPCIEEVLANIDIVAHGQFGNWCIQHICEHGGPPDRSRAIDHVIRYAAEYSTDQFASKVVEKCLKIGGGDFLGRYLDRVCEGRRDRTRIPLIDIASDQYGNYLIQWILNNATPQHRESVAAHIRKHMVSLRGSKFGSRVGMLCTNHAVTTRPGPGVGPGIGGRMAQGPRYGGSYR
ncbi:Pumilio-family RNA binding repeat protein [Sarocladium strictum]